MKSILIISILFFCIASFNLGVYVQKNKCLKSIKQYSSIKKKHKDIVNWLRSELREIKLKKLGKERIDPNKVKLLEILINRLEK